MKPRPKNDLFVLCRNGCCRAAIVAAAISRPPTTEPSLIGVPLAGAASTDVGRFDGSRNDKMSAVPSTAKRHSRARGKGILPENVSAGERVCRCEKTGRPVGRPMSAITYGCPALQ